MGRESVCVHMEAQTCRIDGLESILYYVVAVDCIWCFLHLL
jgi:hypothetical protein